MSLISIIIPLFNEAGNIYPLFDSINKSLKGINFELLMINDGSADETTHELASLSSHHPQLKVITLKRNFGQTAALAAGIDHAAGDVIVLMDGDGQNDPKDIPGMLKKLDQGFDIVSGWRKNRMDNFFSRKIPSWLANRLISWATGVYLHDYGCTLKIYRRSIISNLQLAGEMHRFLPAWCAWQGGKITEVEVTHHPRTKGKSKYGLFRIFKVLIDLATLKFFSGYLFKPNYLFSGSALALMIVGFFSSGFAFYDKYGPDLYAKFRIPLLLLSGFSLVIAVFLALMGLIAELLVRLYFGTMKQKPYRLINE